MFKRITAILEVEGLKFGFSLCCKPQQLGSVWVLNFWMDTGSVYGQRGRPGENLETMADYFALRCALEGTLRNSAQQEIYFLAQLCPYVRSSGAQRILPDARTGRKGRAESISELEAMLRATPWARRGESDRMTSSESYHQTKELLMPEFSQEVQQAYETIRATLFTQAAREKLMDTNRASDIVIENWKRLDRTIGRRGASNDTQRAMKQAMDVFSYESRAAVRRCYSCVWNDLLPHLHRKHKLTEQTTRFLRLMHLEPMVSLEDGSANVSLFHGQVLALHPAMAALMQTPTGQSLVGAFVKAEDENAALVPYQKLLRAIYISLCHYAGRREETRNRRKRQPHSAGDDLERLQEPSHVGRKRRLKKPEK
jgi:hypothetical protein